MLTDFRLKVFISVAVNRSFTQAATELNISQPAISKHIHELESLYGVQLFERSSFTISLTNAGELFLKHALAITENYRLLQLELNLFTKKFKSELTIGASSTIAQYVIAPIIAQFITRFPDIKTSLIGGNSRQIERALADHRIDIGLIEGRSRRTTFHYSTFAHDKLVLVTSQKNRSKTEITINDLKTLPLVLRESGSGTLEVIERELLKCGVKISDLNILLHLGSTESIKQFLESSNAFAILSVAAISNSLDAGTLKTINIEGVTFKRNFSFISIGEPTGAAEKFTQFAMLYNQKL